MNHKDAKHFTWDQRLTLERMLKKGFTKAAIASALGKCERSIYYETIGASVSSRPLAMSL